MAWPVWLRNRIRDRWIAMRYVTNPSSGSRYTVQDLCQQWNAGEDRSSSTFIPYPTFARFCRIPEDEEMPEVLHGNVEAETDDTSDAASIMETDDEESTIGDNDSIQAGVSSQQLIRMAVSGQPSPPSAKRQRTDQYQSKLLTVQLSQEYITCSTCQSKYSTDINNKDDNIRKHLPVISASSKSCDHYFCHGCILKQQASIAEENDGKIPKWIPCMTCRTMTAFCPSEPKYHRMLIDILKQARWTDMAQVKEEEESITE